jgi:Protein of unknown function (DUF3592)
MNIMLHIVNVVTLVGMVALALGLYGSWHAWYAYTSRRWPKTAGRLIYSGVYSAAGAPPVHAPSVRYTYAVNGITYESTRLRFGGTNPFSHRLAISEVTTEIDPVNPAVYFDPNNPRRACLITGPNEWTVVGPVFALLLGTAMCALGVYAPIR